MFLLILTTECIENLMLKTFSKTLEIQKVMTYYSISIYSVAKVSKEAFYEANFQHLLCFFQKVRLWTLYWNSLFSMCSIKKQFITSIIQTSFVFYSIYITLSAFVHRFFIFNLAMRTPLCSRPFPIAFATKNVICQNTRNWIKYSIPPQQAPAFCLNLWKP